MADCFDPTEELILTGTGRCARVRQWLPQVAMMRSSPALVAGVIAATLALRSFGGRAVQAHRRAEKLPPPDAEWLTPEEAAAHIGFDVQFIWDACAKGGLPHVKPNGRNVRIRRSELDRWMLTSSETNNGRSRRR